MSYDKQNWQTGDVITANKLNHIEDGIAGAGGGGGVLITETTMVADVPTLTNTWQEIFDAPLTILRFATEGDAFPMMVSESTKISESEYQIAFRSLISPDTMVFVTNSADGYPNYQGE